MGLKDRVAVIGVGCTRFGESFDQGYFELIVEAVDEACADAKLGVPDLQAAWLGTAGRGHYEGDAGTSLSDPLRFFHGPVTRVSNYCASGLDAFRNACLAVASGVHEIVLAVGVEKMRDVGPRESLVANSVANGHPFIIKGRTAPGFFALCAQRYLHERKAEKRHLALVSVKNHANGAMNPKAHLGQRVDLDAVLNAPIVAKPLGLLDACPTTDGAAAAIITSPEIARTIRDDFVRVKGIGLSVGSFRTVFDPNFDFLGFPRTRDAAAQAYREAGIKDPAAEIDFAEVHDCFTITELLNCEDLRFCPPGEGWRFVEEGHADLKGRLPVNPSGGLLSCGHPVGATGMRMIYELTTQLQGKAGERQVRNATLGLAHNVGGPGALSCVAILGR